MQALEALRAIVEDSGKSGYTISLEMGRASQYLYSTLSRNSVPRADIFSEIADKCGYDLMLVKRKGKGRITIDPPTR